MQTANDVMVQNSKIAADWSFDVTVSNYDALRVGVTAIKLHGSQHRHHRIVLSGTYTLEEAHLLAAQIASCQGMCTGVYLRL